MGEFDHRKSTARLVLKDRDGQPLRGRRVRAELISHEFLFGCGAFELLPMLDPATPAAERERLERVFAMWRELFNYGTLPFYQGRYEPKPGMPDEARTLRAAEALAGLGCKVKGHPLVWHTVSAKWLLGLSPEQVLENQLSRIRREIGVFRGSVSLWDVINEVVIMPVFEKEDNAITRLCQHMGRVPLVKAVFDEARACDPGATLLINDFDLSERYSHLIADCLDAGVPIGAIGLQTHQHQGAMGLEKLQRVVERYTPFGLPLHFTETTFVSGHLMPAEIVDLNDYQIADWPSTPEGEARQARDLAEMIDYLFDCPQVAAMTYWDFEDGGWLGAPSGLIRQDGTRKPAYDALYERVRGAWNTRAELLTDEAGACELRGFRGLYMISAEGRACEVTLKADKPGAKAGQVIEAALS